MHSACGYVERLCLLPVIMIVHVHGPSRDGDDTEMEDGRVRTNWSVDSMQPFQGHHGHCVIYLLHFTHACDATYFYNISFPPVDSLA